MRGVWLMMKCLIPTLTTSKSFTTVPNSSKKTQVQYPGTPPNPPYWERGYHNIRWTAKVEVLMQSNISTTPVFCPSILAVSALLRLSLHKSSALAVDPAPNWSTVPMKKGDSNPRDSQTYCWWKKLCYLSTGPGFLSSTVWWFLRLCWCS